jgi:hypothetical protein
MARDRKNNRIPNGLSFLLWPALVRAPWLLESFRGDDEFEHRHARHHDDVRRRRHDR